MAILTNFETNLVTTGPIADPIDRLHRRNDGWIPFQRKTGKNQQFEPLFSVRARDLPELFPQFIEQHVGENAYYGINATFRPGYGQSKIEPQFRNAAWGNKLLRWLTAAYVDLDCHKIGLSQGDCIGQVINMQDTGAIPPASVIARSGMGVWLFWTLRDDENEDSPARAHESCISTHGRICRKLQNILRHLGADANATDAARITRVPGSLHRTAGRRVDYWFQADENKRPFLYRLDELAVAVNVRPTKYHPAVAKIVDPKRAELGRQGDLARWKIALRKWLLLIAIRGRVNEGCRNHAALLLGMILRKNKLDEADVIDQVRKFGCHQCNPPLEEHQIDAAIASSKDRTRIRDFKIGDWLKITPDEAELVGWPPEGTRPPDDDDIKTTKDRTKARRVVVRQIIELRKSVPTIRQLKCALERDGFDNVSTEQISNDLKVLGINNPRARRPKTNQTAPLLLP